MKNDKPNPWALIDALNERAEKQIFPDLKAKGQKFLDWVQKTTSQSQSDENKKQ
ncbi:MAG: hypothetical protein ABFQ62_00930 [Patescibacteria group bacterium]